jgi:hypothetical protein
MSNCAIDRNNHSAPGNYMKRISWKYITALVIVLVISLMALSCTSPVTPSSHVNNDTISYRDFSLRAESVNLDTLTRGTIFVRGNKEKSGERRVQISAWVEIDAADWGGVSFSIPLGWEVPSIVSDYPQGNPKPETYTSMLQTESKLETYNRIVEIGCTIHGAAKPQGGQGNVIIELVPKSAKQDIGENLEILIGVGSANGYILGPVHAVIQVPLH